MVVDVRGTCDGKEIIFTKDPDSDRWSVVVPFDRDGEYVCDLYATDDYGNTSYYATVLFQLVHACLSVNYIRKRELVPHDGDISLVSRVDGHLAARTDLIYLQVRPTAYHMIATKCELCGGDA